MELLRTTGREWAGPRTGTPYTGLKTEERFHRWRSRWISSGTSKRVAQSCSVALRGLRRSHLIHLCPDPFSAWKLQPPNQILEATVGANGIILLFHVQINRPERARREEDQPDRLAVFIHFVYLCSSRHSGAFIPPFIWLSLLPGFLTFAGRPHPSGGATRRR